MRPQIVTIYTATLLLMNGATVLGQAATKGSNPPPPDQRTPIEAPIDEHMIWLLIAGLCYGIYLAHKQGAFKRIPR